jgi:hypothetical protein
MIVINAVTQETWWITYNADKSIVHYGHSMIGEAISSGQPLSDPLYYNKADWLARLIELGVTPDTPPE